MKSTSTAIILAHLAVSIIHGYAHAELHVGLSAWQKLFVLAVITLGPLAAMVLLWTRFDRAGALLLAASMGGSLAFGAWNHFFAAGPDHVAEVAQGSWSTLFRLTAVLLAILETSGLGLGLGSLRGESRETTPRAKSPASSRR
jgi:hypothetical protein